VAYPLLAIAKEPKPSFRQICAKLDDLEVVDLAPGEDSISIRILFHAYSKSEPEGWAEVDRVLEVLKEWGFTVEDLHDGGGRFSKTALRARLAG
jgi:hypothetical protein